MAALAHKVLIFAAVDGVVVQPLTAKGQRPAPPVKIRYRDAAVSPAPWDVAPEKSSFEAFGIVGLFTVARLSFLVSITRRRQVASIMGSPVYVVTEVAVTPCSSRAEADDAVAKTHAHQLQAATAGDTAEGDRLSLSDSDDEEGLQVPTPDDVDEVDDDAALGRMSGEQEVAGALEGGGLTTVAQDVIGRKGTYGRFTRRWFGRGGSFSDKRPAAVPSEPAGNDGFAAVGGGGAGDADAGPTVSSLLPKLLRTTQVLFGSSRSFFFSYDHDLTRSLGRQRPSAASDEPLCRRVDERFFWNRHLLAPFTLAGHTALALPLMQGFVGQRIFTADSSPPQRDDMPGSVEMSTLDDPDAPLAPPPQGEQRPSERQLLMTLISRRSTQRAGLRYLRRGIDEQGHVANGVETEQILSSPDWSSKAYSFLQIRGSIPLFFTQTPYSFKPAPVIRHSPDANLAACRLHFDGLHQHYGGVQAVNLVEKHGNESIVGDLYRQQVKRINESSEGNDNSRIGWEWFDFHAVCRGMKFERVSLLLDTLRPKIDEFGSTVVAAGGGTVERTQSGVLRTNCMDCLDRTNVCQSSFARHALDAQLAAEGIDAAAQVDQHASWFNELWADNGDAVSKQYASTAAMKGDYTRTRQRNYRGTLNDLGLSVSRFYSGMVNDYFSQAVIDFLLGNVSYLVFDEFEADMMTKDPAVSMTRMRELAIEQCQRRVVADESEEFVGGWVLLAPHSVHSIRSTPLVEVVLLVTDAALYVCQFDWNTDKVASFERIALENITRIRHGTYVTGTASKSQLDEARNVGMLLEYAPGKNVVRRRNTRTLDTMERASDEAASVGSGESEAATAAVGGAPASAASTSEAPANTRTGFQEGLVGLVAGRRSGGNGNGGATGDKNPQPQMQQVALKAPYATTSSITPAASASPGLGPVGRQTESQLVTTICAEIDRLARLAGGSPGGVAGAKSLVEPGTIVTAEEARRATGLLGQLGQSIKRMVWA